MKKVMVVFGTRPEAIKMCPLVMELRKVREFETFVCVTGQHKEMLEQVLEAFDVIPDCNLNIMKEKQSLFDLTIAILKEMEQVLQQVQPDLVLVHGDTTTAYATSLAAFYMRIPVGHVEAGLRTYQLSEPFPEEFNRQSIGILANYHYAPTEKAAENLRREGKCESKIVITGNTSLDALRTTVKVDFSNEILEWAKGYQLLVLTAHRRENLGAPLYHIFQAIKQVLSEEPDVKVVYPVHPNPQVQHIAKDVFGGEERIRLVEPYDVLDFHNIVSRAYLVLTDSGGIQEEAPSLQKPVLVLRNVTERMEGVEAGTLKLVGTKEESVYQALKDLLHNKELYEKMAYAKNPYGDGYASKRIVESIKKELL